MQPDNDLLRQKAEQLAQIESRIDRGSAQAAQAPAPARRGAARPTALLVWLGVAAAGALASAALDGSGMPALAGGLVCLVGLYKAYLAFNNYRADRREQRAADRAAGRVGGLAQQREQLLRELGRLRAADPAPAGRYWWEQGKDPAVAGRLLPGRVPKYDQWTYELLDPMYFSRDGAGVRLEDMRSAPVSVRGDDLRALAAGRGAAAAVLYRDDALLKQGAAFRVMKLFAYAAEPLEEIRSTTTRTRVDKDAQWDACQRKLDALEIGMNAAGRSALMTNQEMYLYGHKDIQEYAGDSLRRGVLEADAHRRIYGQDDYTERTTYRKGFHGLVRFTFICCADVYFSLAEGTRGRVAAIAVPREPQNEVRVTVRTPKDRPALGGALVAHGGHDALEQGETVGRVSIQMAVDFLMGGEMRQTLGLRPRDVLAPRPAGLDDYEWAYLVWHDRD